MSESASSADADETAAIGVETINLDGHKAPIPEVIALADANCGHCFGRGLVQRLGFDKHSHRALRWREVCVCGARAWLRANGKLAGDFAWPSLGKIVKAASSQDDTRRAQIAKLEHAMTAVTADLAAIDAEIDAKAAEYQPLLIDANARLARTEDDRRVQRDLIEACNADIDLARAQIATIEKRIAATGHQKDIAQDVIMGCIYADAETRNAIRDLEARIAASREPFRARRQRSANKLEQLKKRHKRLISYLSPDLTASNS